MSSSKATSQPAQIGKYRVERELGRGATGTVYLGFDSFAGRHVAIKQTHARLLDDPKQASRYRKLLSNEATLAARLHHPHIVALLDADEGADPPYLVLEYVNGESLASFTTPDKLLPISEVLDIAFKCCHALDYAQRLGLVHRDIKPANVLRRADGEIKLTDFGIALLLTADQTHVSGLVGSPAYMSPEQIREVPLTHQSDMFSLGVMLYELLAGRRPFDGDNDFATIYKIGNEAATPLHLIRREVPKQLSEIIERAIAKRPEDRFATWSEFAAELVSASQIQAKFSEEIGETERFNKLRALPFLASFSDVAIWETLRLARWYRLPKGQVLMREDAPGDSFYLLLQGRVNVSRKGVSLSVLDAGVSIGEMVYLQPDQRIRTATVQAETDVVVVKIGSSSLRSGSIELQAQFDKAFIGLLVSRLIAANQQLAALELDFDPKR